MSWRGEKSSSIRNFSCVERVSTTNEKDFRCRNWVIFQSLQWSSIVGRDKPWIMLYLSKLHARAHSHKARDMVSPLFAQWQFNRITFTLGLDNQRLRPYVTNKTQRQRLTNLRENENTEKELFLPIWFMIMMDYCRLAYSTSSRFLELLVSVNNKQQKEINALQHFLHSLKLKD
jgi:hypothetical protein